MSECVFRSAYVMHPRRVHALEVRWCTKHLSTCPPKGPLCHAAEAKELWATVERVRKVARPITLASPPRSMYRDGFNDAMGRILAALDGGAE